MDKFKLKVPDADVADKQPVVRLKVPYYRALVALRTKTGLSLGNIVEQCIDYAFDHMEVDDNAD